MAARRAPWLGRVRRDPLGIDAPTARADPAIDRLEEARRQDRNGGA
jgi:hypothetical protein